MKLLLERWQQFLNEVSFEQAQESLNSKKTRKMIKGFLYDRGLEVPDDETTVDVFTKRYITGLLEIIPQDLTDNQRGTSLLWILRLSRKDFDLVNEIFNNIDSIKFYLQRYLERFFLYQQFMSERDLMKIEQLYKLREIVDEADDDIRYHQKLKASKQTGVEQGVEMFRDDNEWQIAAIHNKGAACSFGQETEWCTADPDANYFEEYYKPDDPLFYFKDKVRDKRYQFHYGTEQFMNEDDHPVDKEVFLELDYLLKQTNAMNKYPIITLQEDRDLAYERSTTTEQLSEIEKRHTEIKILLPIAQHENTSGKTLDKIWDKIKHGKYTASGIERENSIRYYVVTTIRGIVKVRYRNKSPLSRVLDEIAKSSWVQDEVSGVPAGEVLLNFNTSKETRLYLLQNFEFGVHTLADLLYNRELSPEGLEILARDSDSAISTKAKERLSPNYKPNG